MTLRNDTHAPLSTRIRDGPSPRTQRTPCDDACRLLRQRVRTQTGRRHSTPSLEVAKQGFVPGHGMRVSGAPRASGPVRGPNRRHTSVCVIHVTDDSGAQFNSRPSLWGRLAAASLPQARCAPTPAFTP